jgi:nicotinamide phosphoribosyltransferase
VSNGTFRNNPLLNTDSYKVGMFEQYPGDTRYVSSYVESRGGRWNRVLFFGLQMFIDQYMMQPFTQEDIEEADEMWTAHGEPFNRKGFQHILDKHNGFFPVTIEALDEGTVLPTNHVMVQVVNTDPVVPWITTFIETALLRAIWYPTTVATNSFMCKQIIKNSMDRSGTSGLAALQFKLHDFGARGVSSRESAGIGGCAHLINFMGTDTMEGVRIAKQYYGIDMAGFSIPASEHSTITCWGGPNFEIEAFENMIDKFGGEGKVVACVSDSYDIWKSVKKWKSLEPKILDKKMTLVIRPDSGNPVQVVSDLIELLMGDFGYVVNEKGFKVLPDHIRVIQGDGVEEKSIGDILVEMEHRKLSADNVAFGMGGGMLQHFDRDVLRFAMKASAIKRDGPWEDVYKDPITDHGKRSKRGRLDLIQTDYGTWESQKKTSETDTTGYKYGNKLKIRYENGQTFNRTTFEEIRDNAAKGIK